ncbi:adenosine deaminase [Bifidobacterium pseudolongum subsp. globosum]|uniref:Adenine deaminase n=1 Tax=Bifidobacterium pseudolongum subsp. globosum TaxID=1690 RepID=A0A4Q5A224_9BIFI|nr:adenosine deaminase [Bifidobacterium pseudolongum]RYQ10410.1 adenosine deaminase [Bifidobacterium pseudolongum subsp. globosum]
MVDEYTRQALASMPKCELHLHIEGTLEPQLALTLAERNGVALPWTNIDELKAQYEFEDLQSFLNLYYALMKTLKTEEDFKDLMLAYLTRANANGVRHAEIFFDPQVHVCTNGLGFNTVLDGLLEGMAIGRERFGITGGLILSIVRDMDIDSANMILDLAQPRKAEILGIGLDSAEVGHPPARFVDQFARARRFGWHCVAHAGEEGPAAYIRDALDLLHAERIDHGIHIQDDTELLERVARDGVPLTCCPLSNLRLQVVHDMREHPIPRFLDEGVMCTINSDDPAYFGGYVAANYTALVSIGMSMETLAALAGNSIDASFAPEARKTQLHAELATWRTRHGL